MAPQLTAEDRVEIGELLARYNQAIDHFEAEEWASLFTQDGVLSANGTVRASGRERLAAYVASRREAGGPHIRHVLTNIVIDPAEQGARVRAYVLAFRIDDWTGIPYVLGEYDDELVRERGAWRFRLRRMNVVAGRSATGR
ncbi:MAG: nuclear transport factor 2 family protein [Rhizobiaceae bacterium]|nr:nuclear transport factor 2 family protein [Rhizobiaceae bacterium]